MADSNRNRNSKKGSEKETRKGTGEDNRGNSKRPDNRDNASDYRISTRCDTANGKYSRTGIRDEDIDNDDTRGGL